MTDKHRRCRAALHRASIEVANMRETHIKHLIVNTELVLNHHHNESGGTGPAMESLPINWTLISLAMTLALAVYDSIDQRLFVSAVLNLST